LRAPLSPLPPSSFGRRELYSPARDENPLLIFFLSPPPLPSLFFSTAWTVVEGEYDPFFFSFPFFFFFPFLRRKFELPMSSMRPPGLSLLSFFFTPPFSLLFSFFFFSLLFFSRRKSASGRSGTACACQRRALSVFLSLFFLPFSPFSSLRRRVISPPGDSRRIL